MGEGPSWGGTWGQRKCEDRPGIPVPMCWDCRRRSCRGLQSMQNSCTFPGLNAGVGPARCQQGACKKHTPDSLPDPAVTQQSTTWFIPHTEKIIRASEVGWAARKRPGCWKGTGARSTDACLLRVEGDIAGQQGLPSSEVTSSDNPLLTREWKMKIFSHHGPPTLNESLEEVP